MRGFTIMELLITLAITSIIAVIGFTNFYNYRIRRDVRLTAEEIVSVLRGAQSRSLTQEGGNRWGVHFINPSSGEDYYELFWGASYSTSSVIAREILISGIEFLNPGSASSSTIIFNPLIGTPNVSTTIKVGSMRDSSASSTIMINGSGRIDH